MNTIPEDLAGYQNIIMGFIQEGDILICRQTRHKCWAPSASFHFDIEEVANVDVYRKMECPRHEGQTNWEKQRAEANQEPQKAKTDDSKKPPLAKLPWKALRAVSGVQIYGHKKYGDFYNYKKGMEVSRQISCSMRHMADYLDGDDIDKESGHLHLAHAACRILFALENILDGTATDDRYKKP